MLEYENTLLLATVVMVTIITGAVTVIIEARIIYGRFGSHLLLNIIATLTQHFTNTGTTLYNHQMSD